MKHYQNIHTEMKQVLNQTVIKLAGYKVIYTVKLSLQLKETITIIEYTINSYNLKRKTYLSISV